MTEKRFEFREVNCTAIVPKVYDTVKQQYANLFECVHWLNKQDKDIQMLFMEKRELEDALARRERKIKEILQRHYDAKLGNDRIIETIAEDLGVELKLY